MTRPTEKPHDHRSKNTKWVAKKNGSGGKFNWGKLGENYDDMPENVDVHPKYTEED